MGVCLREREESRREKRERERERERQSERERERVNERERVSSPLLSTRSFLLSSCDSIGIETNPYRIAICNAIIVVDGTHLVSQHLSVISVIAVVCNYYNESLLYVVLVFPQSLTALHSVAHTIKQVCVCIFANSVTICAKATF